jgi:hypothetical protein
MKEKIKEIIEKLTSQKKELFAESNAYAKLYLSKATFLYSMEKDISTPISPAPWSRKKENKNLSFIRKQRNKKLKDEYWKRLLDGKVKDYIDRRVEMHIRVKRYKAEDCKEYEREQKVGRI